MGRSEQRRWRYHTLAHLHGEKCADCKSEERKLTIDHIWPKSKGGDNKIRNLQLLCQPCHDIKDNLTWGKHSEHVRARKALRVIEKWK